VSSAKEKISRSYRERIPEARNGGCRRRRRPLSEGTGEAASKESVKVEEPQENGKSHEIGGTVIRERKSSRRNAHRYRVRRLDGRS